MDQKKAAEVWDYINDHQDDDYRLIATALEIPVEEMKAIVFDWALKARGEFIYAYSKDSEHD